MDSPSFQTGSEALQSAQNLVIKIGGENATHLRQNLENARERLRNDQRLILVVSALREHRGGFNTTSHLQEVAQCIESGDEERANLLIDQIYEHTIAMLSSELGEDHPLLSTSNHPNFVEGLRANLSWLRGPVHYAIQERKLFLRHQAEALVSHYDKYDGNTYFTSITGWGECLADMIFYQYFQAEGIDAGVLSRRNLGHDAYRGNAKHVLSNRESYAAALDRVRMAIRDELEIIFEQGRRLVIIPGYLPLLGIERGYSDTGAALVAQAVQACTGNVVCLIPKLFPVMESDPEAHRNGGTDVIQSLTYERAKELMRSGGKAAGVVQLQALRMLEESRIPTVVCSPADEQTDRTTLIS